MRIWLRKPALPPDWRVYLEEMCGSEPFDVVLSDPESSWACYNAYLDVVYRCKGVMPPERMRDVLDQVRAIPVPVSPELQRVSNEAIRELASVESGPSKPYRQGQAVARWLRDRTVGFGGASNPSNCCGSLRVVVCRRFFCPFPRCGCILAARSQSNCFGTAPTSTSRTKGAATCHAVT